jgi:YfaZ precursor
MQSAMAQDLDINLNGHAVQFQYSTPVKGTTHFNKGVLNASALFNSGGDYVLGAGARVSGSAGTGSPGLDVGVGAKVFGGSVDSHGVIALALNGLARYSPPPLPRLGIRGEVYYAPNIVTFVDGTGFFQGDIRVEYEVLPESFVYVGYRRLHIDLRGRSGGTVDSSAHIGIQIHF